VSSSELCTENEVIELVHGFYAAVRGDPLLGPVFAAHVKHWDAHLPKMVDFWSSALRRMARYRGIPMPVHTALPGLDARLFQRWVQLFRGTTAGLANTALRERVDELVRRIAQSLWFGYQLHRDPSHLPEDLACA
jgi:hemoglobin